MRTLTIILASIFLISIQTGSASAQDRHEGYYYPEVTSTENYGARARMMPSANKLTRVGFVTQLTKLQLAAPYPPQYAIFAKGAESEKLIITSLNDDIFGSLFRARGVLAQMTAQARTTPIFQDARVEELLTFLDLLKMLGFQRVTVTNGSNFAHQIFIQ